MGRENCPGASRETAHCWAQRPTFLVLEAVSKGMPCLPEAVPPEQGLKSKNIHSQKSPNTTENSSIIQPSHSVFKFQSHYKKKVRPYGELTCNLRFPWTLSTSRWHLWHVRSLNSSWLSCHPVYTDEECSRRAWGQGPAQTQRRQT